MKNYLFITFLFCSCSLSFAQDLEFTDINAKGKLKMNGNTGTVGQVLTSNGAVAPTWNTLIAPLTTAGGQFFIDCLNITDYSIALGSASTQNKKVNLSSIGYNTNGDVTIDLVNDKIIFNREGLYEFEGIMTYNMISTQAQNASVTFSFVKNATARPYQFTILPNTNGTTYSKLINFKFAHRFNVAEFISFTAAFSDLDTNPALIFLSSGTSSYISGRFVSE